MKRLAFNRLGIFAGIAAIFALVLTGCFGGGGDDESSETTTTTTTATVAPTVSVVTPPPVQPPTPTAAPAPTPTVATPPSPTTAAPASSSSLTYTIQSGDTLAAIADRFNVSVDAIVAANSIDNPDVISVGQQLTIPTGGTGNTDAASPTAVTTASGNTYTVASGDTLAAIANRFNVDLDNLIEVNNIENQDVISVGQQLIIPSS